MHGPENQSCGNLFGDSRREEERTRVEAMAHSQPRPRRMLGLAAASLSLLLVQNAFGFLFRHTGANLSPRTLYRNLDALTDMVLTGSSHVVDHLKTLYELRQLALGASHAERSSVPVSLSSPTVIISSRGGLQLPGRSCAEPSRGPTPSVRPPRYSFFVSPPPLLNVVPLRDCMVNGVDPDIAGLALLANSL